MSARSPKFSAQGLRELTEVLLWQMQTVGKKSIFAAFFRPVNRPRVIVLRSKLPFSLEYCIHLVRHLSTDKYDLLASNRDGVNFLWA